MIRYLTVVAAFLLILPATASADRRVALVIGNGDYKSTIKLPNTRSDAESISALIAMNGFKVFKGIDLTKAQMIDRMVEFSAAATDADVALFFYAGHAIQLGGRNLLIPIDADLKSELHADSQAIDIESILQKTMTSAKVKLVLLDACRDNPFVNQIKRSMAATRSVAVSAGLAEIKPGDGTLIAFATAPGETALDGVGSNSPFTRALLKHIATPGLEIQHAMTQVRAQVQDDTNRQQLPWLNTNITGFFYLGPPKAGQDVAALTPSPSPVAPQTRSDATGAGPAAGTIELELWQSADKLNTVDGYNVYLQSYPGGNFASLARAKIAALSEKRGLTPSSKTSAVSALAEAGEGTEATEETLNLQRSNWEQVQRHLTGAGFKTKADGGIGPGTRQAIKGWQESVKVKATGFLNKAQYDAILASPIREATAKSSEPEERAQPQRTRTRSVSQDGDSPRRAPAQRQQQSDGGSGVAAAVIGGAILGVAASRFLRRR